jgi:hypothetical protein
MNLKLKIILIRIAVLRKIIQKALTSEMKLIIAYNQMNRTKLK